MTLDGIIAAAVGRVAEIPSLAGCAVLDERQGDFAAKVAAEIAKSRLCAIVGWSGFEARGDSCETCFGTVRIAVTVFERPVVNRRQAGATTLLGAAQDIARQLNLFAPGGESPLVLRRITQVSEIVEGVISCAVEFEASTAL